MDCPFCSEPASHHRLMNKQIEVAVWHTIWNGKGKWLVPSDAGIDWDLPVPMAPVKFTPIVPAQRTSIHTARNSLGQFRRLLDSRRDDA